MLILKQVYKFLSKRQKLKAAQLLTLMIVGMLLEMFGIGLILPAVSAVLDTNQVRNYLPLSDYTDFEIILYFMLSLSLVFFIKTFFLLFLTWTQAKFSFRTGANISERLLDIYLKQPYLFHSSKNSAELIRNVTLEANMFVQVLTALLVITSELFVVFGLVVFIFLIQPYAALTAIIIFIFFGFLLERLLKKVLESLGKERQEYDFERLRSIQQGLGAIKTTKIMGKEDEFKDRFVSPNQLLASVGIKIQTIQAFPRLWFELLVVIFLSIVIVFISYSNSDTSTLIPLLALFGAAAFRLLPSANRLLSSFQSLRFNSVVIENLKNELDLINSIDVQTNHQSVTSFASLSLKNLTYRYPNSNVDILNNQSLEILKGQRVGVIGESGSGKTTLINIILGLIEPMSGSIELDGEKLGSIKKSWQEKIGYVPQEVYLDDDSLIKNIAFGVKEKEINLKKVQEAVDQAQLNGFVKSLDEGLESNVGERGGRISGGQKQRIGLARALYHNPKVLVLDEATSALDTETEMEVMQSVYELDKELTIIIVAHRLSSLEGVDTIIKVDKGKLILTNK